MRTTAIATSVMIGLSAAAPAADGGRSLQFMWDFAPLQYDLDIGGSGLPDVSKGGTFDDNDRASLRYLSDQGHFSLNSGWFAGGEAAYSRYADDNLHFETIAFSGVLGCYLQPVEWWRGSLYGRFGIAFDETEISFEIQREASIISGLASYGTSGLQYAAGVSSDFIIARHLVLTAFAGVQGQYSSAVSWWYYYSYPSTYIEVETYGASYGAALGYRF